MLSFTYFALSLDDQDDDDDRQVYSNARNKGIGPDQFVLDEFYSNNSVRQHSGQGSE